MTILFHNPRCGKSREALRLLEEKEEDFEIVKYLEAPLDKEELHNLVNLLDIKPIALVRQQEKIWKDNYKWKDMSDEQVIEAIAKYPKLMERPVVIHDNRAVIGRPPEKVLEIL